MILLRYQYSKQIMYQSLKIIWYIKIKLSLLLLTKWINSEYWSNDSIVINKVSYNSQQLMNTV